MTDFIVVTSFMKVLEINDVTVLVTKEEELPRDEFDLNDPWEFIRLRLEKDGVVLSTEVQFTDEKTRDEVFDKLTPEIITIHVESLTGGLKYDSRQI